MHTLKSQKGQALIIIALAAVVLFGFTALTIDGSRVFADRRHAQNAADTSAIAAALAKIRGQNYTQAATTRAASNGYQNDADSTVTVNLCSETGVTCLGLPANAKKSEYIKVRITSDVSLTFARILGQTVIQNQVEAIARAQGSVVNPSPFVGAGMVAVKGGNDDKCFQINGTADLAIHSAGIFVNCTGNSSLFMNGNPTIGMDTDANVAGCANNPGYEIGTGNINCNATSQTIDASTFAGYPTTVATPACPANPGTQSGGTLTPGYFNSNVTISVPTTLAPGTYCFNAGVKIMGGGSLNGGAGTVQIVLDQDLYLKSASTFDDLEVYMTNAAFGTSTASGSLTANRFRFFGSGTGSLDIQNGTFISNDTYIYSEAGTIDIQSQANVQIAAPTSGDFAGMLMHMPWSNTNPFTLNGGTSSRWTGLVLVPHSDVTYNGGSGFELHGQVIGYTFKLNGSGHSDIYYESTVAGGPPANPTIELTK